MNRRVRTVNLSMWCVSHPLAGDPRSPIAATVLSLLAGIRDHPERDRCTAGGRDHAEPASRQDRRSSPANACWRRSHHAIMAAASRRRSSTTQSAARICPARFGSLTVPTLLTSPRGRLGIGAVTTGSVWSHSAPWRAKRVATSRRHETRPVKKQSAGRSSSECCRYSFLLNTSDCVAFSPQSFSGLIHNWLLG